MDNNEIPIIDNENENYQSFLERIISANGDIIPLPGAKSRVGENIAISARFGKDEDEKDNKDYLLIDVFAEENGEYTPIGHYDWEIVDGAAKGDKRRHGHLPAVSQAHLKADRESEEQAFKVKGISIVSHALNKGGFDGMQKVREKGIIKSEDDWQEPVYQKLGIGRMLISASSVILNAKGVREANLGSLSNLAEDAWRPFNVEDAKKVNVSELSKHPLVENTIKRFVNKTKS